MASRRTLVPGVLLAVLAAVLPVVPAQAHDALVGTVPPADAVLEQPPDVVRLTFTDEILPTAPGILVRSADGETVIDAVPALAGREASTVLPPGLADGTYTVSWRVVSADGHPISGSFAFTVRRPASTTAPQPSAAAGTTATAGPTSTTGAAPAPGSAPTTPAAPSATGDSSSPVALVVGGSIALLVLLAAAWLIRRRKSSTSQEKTP